MSIIRCRCYNIYSYYRELRLELMTLITLITYSLLYKQHADSLKMKTSWKQNYVERWLAVMCCVTLSFCFGF